MLLSLPQTNYALSCALDALNQMLHEVFNHALSGPLVTPAMGPDPRGLYLLEFTVS